MGLYLYPTSYKSALNVEFPHPTIRITSFGLIYLWRRPHSSGYSPYLQKKINTFIPLTIKDCIHTKLLRLCTNKVRNSHDFTALPFKRLWPSFPEEGIPIFLFPKIFMSFWQKIHNSPYTTTSRVQEIWLNANQSEGTIRKKTKQFCYPTCCQLLWSSCSSQPFQFTW